MVALSRRTRSHEKNFPAKISDDFARIESDNNNFIEKVQTIFQKRFKRTGSRADGSFGPSWRISKRRFAFESQFFGSFFSKKSRTPPKGGCFFPTKCGKLGKSLD